MPYETELQKLIQINDSFAAWPGPCFGIEQSTALVSITLPTIDDSIHTRVIEFIAKHCPEEFSSLTRTLSQKETLLAHLIYWHLSIQREVRIPVFDDFQIVSSKSANRAYLFTIAIPTQNSEASRTCLKLVISYINQIITGKKSPNKLARAFQEEQANTLKAISKYGLKGTNQYFLAKAANELKVPYQHYISDFFTFGTGHYSRVFFSTMTDLTPSTASYIARNKYLTSKLLRNNGFPAPKNFAVKSEADAIELAKSMGYPVVIKPNDLDGGKGVSANLSTEETLIDALHTARKYSESLLIEEHINGEDYRFIVFQGKVIKIMHRQPGSVSGDGVLTIRQLVEQEQLTPKRQTEFLRDGKMRIELDTEALGIIQERGLLVDEILPRGYKLPLRRKSNISSGGSNTLVRNDEVHPEYLHLAIEVAQLFRLDFAGIDIITDKISSPMVESSCSICEVNSQPQIGIKATPDIYHEIIQDTFEAGHSIGLDLLITAAPMIEDTQLECFAHKLTRSSYSTSGKVWVSHTKTTSTPKSAFQAAKHLLSNKRSDSGLIHMPMEELLSTGLPCSHFDRVIFVAESEAESVELETFKVRKFVSQNCDSFETVTIESFNKRV